MLDLKFVQAGRSIGFFRAGGVVERAEVEEGLKGMRDGAMRALRFSMEFSESA